MIILLIYSLIDVMEKCEFLKFSFILVNYLIILKFIFFDL